MEMECVNTREQSVDEIIAKAEAGRQIKAYQCHYCQHSKETYDEERGECAFGINPDAHIREDAMRCRQEFMQYEFYDRATRTLKKLDIPADCYDRRYKGEHN